MQCVETLGVLDFFWQDEIMLEVFFDTKVLVIDNN
jgi:hypothetical protein